MDHAPSIKGIAWGVLVTALLAALIVVGSRNLEHFDAALVGYTFATLFATFGIIYRYAMWLQRPPTRLYWRRGWQLFLTPRHLGRNLAQLARRFGVMFALNAFIWRRGLLRGAAHWLIMWGCVIAAAITFPLVFGWIHFETELGNLAGKQIGQPRGNHKYGVCSAGNCLAESRIEFSGVRYRMA